MAKAKKPAAASSKATQAAKSDAKETQDKAKVSGAAEGAKPDSTASTGKSTSDKPAATPTPEGKSESAKSGSAKPDATKPAAKSGSQPAKSSSPTAKSDDKASDAKPAKSVADTAKQDKPGETKSATGTAASGKDAKNDKLASGTSDKGDTAKPADAYANTVSKPASGNDTAKTAPGASGDATKSEASKAGSQKAGSAASATAKTSESAAQSPASSSAPEKTAPSQSNTTPPAAASQGEPAKRRSVFWPLVLGGLVAGGLGFAASEFDLLERRSAPVEDGDWREAVAQQQERITALENAPAPEAPVATGEAVDLAPLEAQIETLTQSMNELSARIEALEARPAETTTPEDITAVYDSEIAQLREDLGAEQSELRQSIEAERSRLRETIESQRAEIQTLLENARSVEEATADAARDAAVQAALTRISTAVANGNPFAAAVQELEAAGVSDIPEALRQSAENGVATLANLQDRFPDAARSALSAARVAGGDTSETGVAGFLRRQLGARSVAPRDGTDPDAVLSRAEAAVRDGRLTDALAEIETLPEPAQAAMQEWLQDARARQSAEAATEELAQRLTAN